MVAFLEKVRLAVAALEVAGGTRHEPFLEPLEALLRDVEAIQPATILKHLGVPIVMSNQKRLAARLRALGFIPTQSPRFSPEGIRSRGWVRAELIRQGRYDFVVTDTLTP